MKIAIFIYIEHYKTYAPLVGCQKDYLIVKEIFEEKSIGDTKTLVIDDSKSYLEVILELDRFVESVKSLHIEEAFFFFSGHGQFHNETFYHILNDTNIDDLENTALSNLKLDIILRKINAELTVKIIDACNSGSFYVKGDLDENNIKSALEKSSAAFKKCFFLFSSQEKQYSYLSNGISKFTKAIGECIVLHESQKISYGELAVRLGEKFKDDKVQNPFFISQGNFTETFCEITAKLKENLTLIIDNNRKVPIGKTSINKSIHDLHRFSNGLIENIDKLISISSNDNDDFLIKRRKAIKLVIENTQPREYKVAIVGRFKAGKSSFVNLLCGDNIASVNSNPETAVITVIKYGQTPKAEIHFVSKEEWEKIRNDEDSRYLKLNALETKGEIETQISMNLKEMEEKYITDEGLKIFIGCAGWDDKHEKSKFLKDIKKYVVSREPYHYIVNKVIIYLPNPILDDEIEIIDTPGLEDSDRYRATITEKMIDEVDAILYLTTSGASFSASEQDFLVNQMRRGNLKNINLIVTKLDSTFESACLDAKNNDETPPKLSDHLDVERRRLHEKIDETFQSFKDAIGDTEQTSLYLSLLNGINLNFISSHYYLNGKKEESGIPQLLNDLKLMLVNNDRLLNTRNYLIENISLHYKRIFDFCELKVKTLLGEVDSDLIKLETNKILNLISSKRQPYELKIRTIIDLFCDDIKREDEIHTSKLESLVNQSSEIIDEYLNKDLSVHWKSRRYMKWGFLNDLQTNIANKIFPHFDSILNQRIILCLSSLEKIKSYTKQLQSEIAQSEEKLKDIIPQRITVANVFDNQTEILKNEIEDYIKSQKSLIVRHLENFVSQKVETSLLSSRNSVAQVFGRGTSIQQQDEIQRFYSLIKSSLSLELSKYLQNRFHSFNQALTERVEQVFPNLIQSVEDVVNDGVLAMENDIKEITQRERQSLAGSYTDVKFEIDDAYKHFIELYKA